MKHQQRTSVRPPASSRPAVFRSTKGASRQRRSCINREISALRELLPVAECTRQRLSQLQTMCLTCVYIRKSHHFARLLPTTSNQCDINDNMPFNFSQAIPGFLLVVSTDGKLLYVSENVADYLGHSPIDLLAQGDNIYDVIDRRDHLIWRMELQQRATLHHHHSMQLQQLRNCHDVTAGSRARMSHLVTCCQTLPIAGSRRCLEPGKFDTSASGVNNVYHRQHSGYRQKLDEERTFYCRMLVARTCRRSMASAASQTTVSGCHEHKLISVRGHFVTTTSSGDVMSTPTNQQRVFVAVCFPAVTSNIQDGFQQLAALNTAVFTSIHSLDMKYLEISNSGQYQLGWTERELAGRSWYELIHPEDLLMAAEEHRRVLGLNAAFERSTSTTESQLTSVISSTTAPLVPSAGPANACSILAVRQQTRTGRWLRLNVSFSIQPYSQHPQSTSIDDVIDFRPSDQRVIVCVCHVIAFDDCESSASSSQNLASKGDIVAIATDQAGGKFLTAQTIQRPIPYQPSRTIAGSSVIVSGPLVRHQATGTVSHDIVTPSKQLTGNGSESIWQYDDTNSYQLSQQTSWMAPTTTGLTADYGSSFGYPFNHVGHPTSMANFRFPDEYSQSISRVNMAQAPYVGI